MPTRRREEYEVQLAAGVTSMEELRSGACRDWLLGYLPEVPSEQEFERPAGALAVALALTPLGEYGLKATSLQWSESGPGDRPIATMHVVLDDARRLASKSAIIVGSPDAAVRSAIVRCVDAIHGLDGATVTVGRTNPDPALDHESLLGRYMGAVHALTGRTQLYDIALNHPSLFTEAEMVELMRLAPPGDAA